ncbi:MULTISPECIES: DUF1566 domain-containing protein [unclassified Legionella]|uniref:DUF1566 domain-containing protein n=1 Tax=unclassified Legionella TaxID=2622702 RepID=UPI0010547262|nr:MULTISPECIES: DUF1566 domain-containing protein [unclassified Legionella]MDI9819724.1 DUF1566 domain-containing protein [Legionella sp. PL877]
MIRKKISTLVFFASCLLLSAAQAAKPLWTLTPASGSHPTQTVPANATVELSYTVENQSGKPRRLTILAMPGVRQNAPCQLAPKGQPAATCILRLVIIGSEIPQNGIHGGPSLCQTDSEGRANPNQCYRPSAGNILHITKGDPGLASISVYPQVLDLEAGSGTPGFLTITNNSSSISALNSKATLPSGWTDVNQDASNCLIIAPGGNCQLQLTPGVAVHPMQIISISGSNTTKTTAQVSVSPPAQANLSVTGAPLTLSPACGTGTTLTITNTSTTATAENLSIDLGALLGDVQLSNDNCSGNSLPPNGGQCTFDLQGINPIAAHNITVEDNNGALVNASVEVRQLQINDIYQQGIVFEVDNCNNGKAAAQQQSQSPWGGWNGGAPNCIETNVTDLNNGATNTETIYNVLTTNNNITADSYAAGICYEFSVNSNSNSPCDGNSGEVCYTNWYLPALNELTNLRNQTTFNGGPIGGFNPGQYWSSSEHMACTAFAEDMLDGLSGFISKFNNVGVRCIRVFSPSTM